MQPLDVRLYAPAADFFIPRMEGQMPQGEGRPADAIIVYNGKELFLHDTISLTDVMILWIFRAERYFAFVACSKKQLVVFC